MTLNAYANAAKPVILYAADARGTKVPDFALIMAPMCEEHAAHVQIVARQPDEPGHAFHERVIELEVPTLAWGRDQLCQECEVMFIDSLPPVAWRQRQLRRYALHWQATYAQNAMARVEACRQLRLMLEAKEGAAS